MDLEKTIREVLKNNAHMNHNHIEMVSVEPDHAVFQLEIHPDSKNPYGMVHGGALYLRYIYLTLDPQDTLLL